MKTDVMLHKFELSDSCVFKMQPRLGLHEASVSILYCTACPDFFLPLSPVPSVLFLEKPREGHLVVITIVIFSVQNLFDPRPLRPLTVQRGKLKHETQV